MDNIGLEQANVLGKNIKEDVSTEVEAPRDQLLRDYVRNRAVNAWPNLKVDIESFATLVLTGVTGADDRLHALSKLAIEELFLCFACSAGDEVALESFSREFEGELKAAANKVSIAGANYDDIRQILWNRLFVGDGKRGPRILDYRGIGPLRHWFRVLVARTVLDSARQQRREVSKFGASQRALSDAVPKADPELENIRRRYSGDFRSSFEKAIGEMTAEERNFLRCAYLNGMSTDEIGRAFGMHKATAARHVAKARERLLELTRLHLKRQLGASSGELDSVIRLFDGELSVSLSRLLK